MTRCDQARQGRVEYGVVVRGEEVSEWRVVVVVVVVMFQKAQFR